MKLHLFCFLIICQYAFAQDNYYYKTQSLDVDGVSWVTHPWYDDDNNLRMSLYRNNERQRFYPTDAKNKYHKTYRELHDRGHALTRCPGKPGAILIWQRFYNPRTKNNRGIFWHYVNKKGGISPNNYVVKNTYDDHTLGLNGGMDAVDVGNRIVVAAASGHGSRVMVYVFEEDRFNEHRQKYHSKEGETEPTHILTLDMAKIYKSLDDSGELINSKYGKANHIDIATFYNGEDHWIVISRNNEVGMFPLDKFIEKKKNKEELGYLYGHHMIQCKNGEHTILHSAPGNVIEATWQNSLQDECGKLLTEQLFFSKTKTDEAKLGDELWVKKSYTLSGIKGCRDKDLYGHLRFGPKTPSIAYQISDAEKSVSGETHEIKMAIPMLGEHQYPRYGYATKERDQVMYDGKNSRFILGIIEGVMPFPDSGIKPEEKAGLKRGFDSKYYLSQFVVNLDFELENESERERITTSEVESDLTIKGKTRYAGGAKYEDNKAMFAYELDATIGHMQSDEKTTRKVSGFLESKKVSMEFKLPYKSAYEGGPEVHPRAWYIYKEGLTIIGDKYAVSLSKDGLPINGSLSEYWTNLKSSYNDESIQNQAYNLAGETVTPGDLQSYVDYWEELKKENNYEDLAISDKMQLQKGECGVSTQWESKLDKFSSWSSGFSVGKSTHATLGVMMGTEIETNVFEEETKFGFESSLHIKYTEENNRKTTMHKSFGISLESPDELTEDFPYCYKYRMVKTPTDKRYLHELAHDLNKEKNLGYKIDPASLPWKITFFMEEMPEKE